MISKYKLIIFDCDGTLVDSEATLNCACSKVLMQMGYTKYTEEYCKQFRSLGWPQIIEYIQQHDDRNFSTKIFWERARRIAIEEIRLNSKQILGASELLTALKQQFDIQIAVASNGEKDNVIQLLQSSNLYSFFQLQHIFNYMDSDGIAKPNPDLFLYVANFFQFKSSECLVIEDSIAGTKAAQSAMMDVIAVDVNNPQISQVKTMRPLAIVDNLIQILNYL